MLAIRPLSCLVVAALVLTLSASSVPACPFCSAPSQTMAEQVAQADAACLVEWVSGHQAKEQDPGNSTYEIVQAIKGPRETVKKGKRIELTRFRAGKKGDLFLLMGTRAGKEGAVEWGSPTEITETAFNYVAQAPSPEVPAQKRLVYFVKFLEFPDPLVSNDAYAEFSNAPYKDIAAVAPLLPRQKIHAWVASPETPATRLGLYGMLLGLCGRQEDASVLAAKIAEKTENFRIGIDGVISGYLLITGSSGLNHIDDWKFKDHGVPFSETYAGIMGLRFMWQYAGGKIPNDRLMQSMRLLLDRPELTDLVITDLARWNDWSVQERLMNIYGKEPYNIPAIKRAIVRFMLASTQVKQKPAARAAAVGTASDADASSSGATSPAKIDYAERGKKYLAEIRKQDPRTVKEAERFFSN